MTISKLSGERLDLAVALADGWDLIGKKCPGWVSKVNKRSVMEYTKPYRYSDKWEFGGPIIERTFMTIEFQQHVGWRAALDEPQIEIVGAETPLIAAMRCFVASKRVQNLDKGETKGETS